jgi:hypothetical protein
LALPEDLDSNHPSPSTSAPTLFAAIARELRARTADAGAPRVGTLLLVALLALTTWLPRLRGPLDLRYDGGVYYILGVSLAEGRGYRLLNEPGEIHAIQYPPLLPLMVAAYVKVMGTADPLAVGRALRVTYFVLSLLYAMVVYATARLFLAERLALAAAVLTTFYCFTYFLSDLLFAELPFALVTTLFVLARRRAEPLRSWLQALLGLGAVLLRTLGVALVLAWSVEALLRRRFKTAALRALVMVLPLVAWHGYVSSVRSGPEYRAPQYTYQRAPYLYYNVSYRENVAYRDPFRPELGTIPLPELLSRTARQASKLPMLLGESVSAPERFWEWTIGWFGHLMGFDDLPAYERVATAIVGLVVIAGVVALAFQGEALVSLYVAFTLGLIFATPWPVQFTRYAAPLTAFLAIAFVLALDTVRRVALHFASPARVLLNAGAVALAVCVGAIEAIAISRTLVRYHYPVPWRDGAGRPIGGRFFYYDRAWTAFDLSLEWLKAEAGRDDIVASSAPHNVYLRTGLKAVMPPMEADIETAQRLLDSVPVTYVIVDGLAFADITRRYARPVMEGRPMAWELVYSGDGPLRIYRRRAGVPRAGDAAGS